MHCFQMYHVVQSDGINIRFGVAFAVGIPTTVYVWHISIDIQLQNKSVKQK